MSDIIGAGWSFPVQLDSRRAIALSRGEQELEQSILIILLTPPGNRPRRPEFGCRIHELVFSPNDSTTAGLAAYYVQQALAQWEPRITVLDVDAASDPDAHERLAITISYEIKATHDRRSLVFPFYRIPGE